MPEPEEDEDPRMPHGHPVRARWERAVEMTASDAHRILSHGPASGAAGGEVLFGDDVLQATVMDLTLEQRVDLLWRRPDGTLEAVLVLDEGQMTSRRCREAQLRRWSRTGGASWPPP